MQNEQKVVQQHRVLFHPLNNPGTPLLLSLLKPLFIMFLFRARLVTSVFKSAIYISSL